MISWTIGSGSHPDASTADERSMTRKVNPQVR
jgi:hypothetical protein